MQYHPLLLDRQIILGKATDLFTKQLNCLYNCKTLYWSHTAYRDKWNGKAVDEIPVKVYVLNYRYPSSGRFGEGSSTCSYYVVTEGKQSKLLVLWTLGRTGG